MITDTINQKIAEAMKAKDERLKEKGIRSKLTREKKG